MAIFRKTHSRAAPVVETPSVFPGVIYSDGKMHYTAQLSAPGGPPYKYYELLLTEEEMLRLVAAWLEKLSAKRQFHGAKSPSPTGE